MNRADVTPTPVAVDVKPVPRARDSAGGLAVEVMTEPPRSGHVHKTRGRVMRTLILPTAIITVGVVGTNPYHAVSDNMQKEKRAAVARIEAETPPAELQMAQMTAAKSLFWVNGKGADMNAVKELANRSGYGEPLDARNYLNPEHVQISPDGHYFTVKGKNYELAKRETEEGDVYVWAGRHLTEEGVFTTRERLVGKLLVGGARNDTSSDLNKDGTVTPEEVSQSADLSVRHNLEIAFRPPQQITDGRLARNKNK